MQNLWRLLGSPPHGRSELLAPLRLAALRTCALNALQTRAENSTDDEMECGGDGDWDERNATRDR